MNLSPTLRWLLGGVAAVVAFLAAFDPFGMSHTAQGIVACAAVLFAALGIVPPQVGGTQSGVVNPSVVEPPDADIKEAPSSVIRDQRGLSSVEVIGILLLVGVGVILIILI